MQKYLSIDDNKICNKEVKFQNIDNEFSATLFKLKDVGIDGLVYDVFIDGGVMRANARLNTINCSTANANELNTENLNVTDK